MEVFRSILHDPWQAAENTRKRILTRYGYNSLLAPNDCLFLLNVRGRFARLRLEEDRITAIRTNPRLLAWLIIDNSSMLLLDGNTERLTNNETSFVAARVVEGTLNLLEQQKPNVKVIPLAFFCGCHRLDSYATVPQLAMSLLLTLVDIYKGFDAITLQECINEINEHDFVSIVNLLEKLVLRLPQGVIVVLVVDGLRYFSQPRTRSQEMQEVMARLVGIYRKSPRATLKFLFTNASKSDPVRGLLCDDEVLRIPKDLPMRGGCHGSRWNSKIEFIGM